MTYNPFANVVSLDQPVGLDVPPVRPTLALHLIAHHLSCAASLFEVTPKDTGALKAAVADYLGISDPDDTVEHPAYNAALVFIDTLQSWYEEAVDVDFEEEDA